MAKLAVTLPKVKSFESELNDPVYEQIRHELLGSRRYPECIFVADKAEISKIEEILIALHGLRGQRTPVLHDPDLRQPYEIKWGL